jgi:hypothetical protein
MNALKEVSKVWLVAKMVHVLFESILGNKVLEERLQKAAGKRHSRNPQAPNSAAARTQEPPKRKFDDMELGFSNGPPAPQVSYERSRPQTPAVTPSRELGNATSMPAMPAPSAASTTSPHLRTQGDAFMGGAGGSRSNTRPPTPFNPSYSVPATPPDLYLVTRNSPPISQSLWENFQPDQLFPEGTGANMNLPMFSPGQSAIDPQLAQQGLGNMPTHPQQMPPQSQQQHHQQQRGPRVLGPGSPMQNLQQPGMGMNYTWPNQFDTIGMTTGPEIGSPDDSWSNSSKGQAPVPTTLNVEDWYVADTFTVEDHSRVRY